MGMVAADVIPARGIHASASDVIVGDEVDAAEELVRSP
jgi:hypothetical protein